MKLIIASLIVTSVWALAAGKHANKVVQKIRVLDEKIVSAEGCSITGEPKNISYGIRSHGSAPPFQRNDGKESGHDFGRGGKRYPEKGLAGQPS